MSDDSFFREVSEELRQDRVKAIWTRFGTYILAAVILVVVIINTFFIMRFAFKGWFKTVRPPRPTPRAMPIWPRCSWRVTASRTRPSPRSKPWRATATAPIPTSPA